MILRRVVSALALVGMVACGGGSDDATVDGTGTGSGFSPATPVAPLPASSLVDIALAHNALIFDPARGAYYASVPGSVVGTGNTIARIDAATGVVTYSRAVGSAPGPLALARDGSALYVGANGSGEVLKLGLPDLEEQWRTRLPATSFSGQVAAETLAVSPDDPNVVAVSMRNTGFSPRHEGVALIRAGALQPRRTQGHTGANLITFGADGAFVYGFNNETSEYGLRRIAVAADGLIEQTVVPGNGGNFSTRSIDRMGSGFVLGAQVYTAPAMALMGQASNASGCRPASQGERLLCFGMSSGPFGDGTVAVVDARTFATIAMPSYLDSSETSQTSFVELVPGPSGQVALRRDETFQYQSATGIRLLSNPVLR